MKKIIGCIVFACLQHMSADTSWSSIGGGFSGFGSGFVSGVKSMAQGMIGAVPAGYYYSFQVFNGSTIPVSVAIKKAKSIMGARWNAGTGDTAQLNPGQDSQNTFTQERLYFSIEVSGDGLNFSEDHYVLGQRNDDTVYYYHAYNDKDTGDPAVELLGGGYTTSAGFSGRIQNKTNEPTTITYSLISSATPRGTLTMTIPDIDPQSFNYLTPPSDCSMRPSAIVFANGTSIPIESYGISQITTTAAASSATSQTPAVKPSQPSTYNYVFNGAKAFETGMGPGMCDQPTSIDVLRDISPVECQIYYQNAANSFPLIEELPNLTATFFPYDRTGESLWYVYAGYGWSQEQKQIIQNPCGQIPIGQCASCFIIRPSQQSFKNNAVAGRFYVVRLSVSEQSNATDQQRAKTFLTNLVTGKLSVMGLLSSQTIFAEQEQPFIPGAPLLMYPPLSATPLSATVTINTLTTTQKAALLGTVLPDSVDLLSDAQTNVSGYIMASDIFFPYGQGVGPYGYSTQSPYLDVSQMISFLESYAALVNFSASGTSLLEGNQQIGGILGQTVLQWLQTYSQNPDAVKKSIATFLFLLAQGNTTELLAQFGQGQSTPYFDSKALSKLSPQGAAFLKLFLYGPCSMTHNPTYYYAGSSYFAVPNSFPPVSVFL